VLPETRTITQSSVKRICAKALNDVIHDRRISRDDAGDALGCSGRTIANRLDAETSDCQMTVYELARGIKEFGPAFGNAILTKLTGYILAKAGAEELCPSEIKITTSKALTLLLEVLEDNDLSDEDAILLAPVLIKLVVKYQAIVAKAYAATGGRS
jgi:hypothetical protein